MQGRSLQLAQSWLHHGVHLDKVRVWGSVSPSRFISIIFLIPRLPADWRDILSFIFPYCLIWKFEWFPGFKSYCVALGSPVHVFIGVSLQRRPHGLYHLIFMNVSLWFIMDSS